MTFKDDKAIAVEKIDTPTFLKDQTTDKKFAKSTNDDGDVTWAFEKGVTSLNSATVKYYLVGSNGTIAKGKSSAKDGNDYKFTVDSSYEITKVVLEN